MFRPDVTETGDWALKTSYLPTCLDRRLSCDMVFTYLGLLLGEFGQGRAMKLNEPGRQKNGQAEI